MEEGIWLDSGSQGTGVRGCKGSGGGDIFMLVLSVPYEQEEGKRYCKEEGELRM